MGQTPNTRVAPCGFEHAWDPFLLGAAAAEFMPADPAAWFDAACAERMTFGISELDSQMIVFRNSGADRDDARKNFWRGLLYGTPGGHAAVSDWMAARGLEVILEGAFELKRLGGQA